MFDYFPLSSQIPKSHWTIQRKHSINNVMKHVQEWENLHHRTCLTKMYSKLVCITMWLGEQASAMTSKWATINNSNLCICNACDFPSLLKLPPSAKPAGKDQGQAACRYSQRVWNPLVMNAGKINGNGSSTAPSDLLQDGFARREQEKVQGK